ncbi:MAG: hypothetical protein MK193_12640 [Lentisphaeria bacterium]|nr:hypothetical protein [Lentisphaeria bacterium]
MTDKTSLFQQALDTPISFTSDHRWLVLRSKPRAEKKVFEYLKQNKIQSFLPVRPSVKKYGNRTRINEIPIFSGYIFACCPYPNYDSIMHSSHIAYPIIPEHGEEAGLVKDLNNIQLMMSQIETGDLVIRPEIAVGDVVQVKQGPLKGLSGIVESWKDKIRLFVNIDLVGQSLSIELDSSDIDVER